jgi:nucleoside-diphosphate-sugar epimerase
VILLQRGVSRPAPDASGRLTVVRGSITDSSLVRQALDRVDVVCHLAALMPPESNPDVFAVNVEGTFNILEAIRLAGGRARVVLASTDATYGTGYSKRPYPDLIKEAGSLEPTVFYGISKILGEELVRRYSKLYDLRYVILRYCWVFSDSEVLDLFSTKMWLDFMTDEQRQELSGSDAVPILYEEDGKPFADHIVDARDVAEATALAAFSDRALGEVLNVCGPKSFRYVDLSPRVAERLGRPVQDLQLRDFHSYAFDTSKARQLLGFTPRYSAADMVEEALAKVVTAGAG